MDNFVLKDSVTSRMTDDEFLRFCAENSNLRIERNNKHEIIIMSPVNSLGGLNSGEVFRQLSNWNYETGKGVAFDSSAGFTLPDSSVLSPDASWLSTEKWGLLSEDEKNTFAKVCPEFIIEVRSKSDSLSELKMKMKAWLKNGALLAWLIDPLNKSCYIFRPNQSEETIKGLDKKITGEEPVTGFVLDLSNLKI
jgi:Uma2 family endonuclease